MKTNQLTITIILISLIFCTSTVFAQTNSNTNSAIMVNVGSINGTSYPNGNYAQTVNFDGNVKVQTEQSVVVKVFKNDHIYKTDLVPISNKTSGGLFYYTITVEGKGGLDSYKIDFTYGNQIVEKILPLTRTGIPPIPEFGSLTGVIIMISIIGSIMISKKLASI